MTGLAARHVAEASTTYDETRITPQGVFWLEGRASGQDAVVCWTREQGRRDITPDGFSVGSLVHEYGGGAWGARDGTLWFCDSGSQLLYKTTCTGAIPVVPAPGEPGSHRYADLCVDRDGRHLWAVRERHEHGTVINELVRITADGKTSPSVVASGWDFYAFPRLSPDGRRLAWTCWNAPLMPWDGTYLYVADIAPDATLGAPVLVAGGPEESVFQPQWSPRGVLHFVSDRSGWWNLYAREPYGDAVVVDCDAELGVAQWEFGYSTYVFLGGDRIAVLAQRGGSQTVEIVGSGSRRSFDLPFTSIKPYLSARGSTVALIGASPVATPSVVLADVDTGAVTSIAGEEPLGRSVTLSAPEPFVFTARDGLRVHGLYYQPWRASSGPPPLVVKAHPGPTANFPMRLDWHTQYLCSHGFAVAEIDYRGSTGYGRSYRNALRGQWGEGDALDSADAAGYLGRQGLGDPQRTAIWGASAGAYTALRAVILTDVFAACIARSPVIDPGTWSRAAPKFQAHQAQLLVGGQTGAPLDYRTRSVLVDAHAISCPVLLIHGGNDQI
ncbi:S9 family peptidase, partial [Actinocrinis sp.]|uniref:S9 family peptidase n=1 Tax=Actinocrinis sp. TaxID=1920516 RepID=UPI002D4DB5FC